MHEEPVRDIGRRGPDGVSQPSASTASPVADGTLAFPEFVALMAMLVSIIALSTDIMLPALVDIGAELAVRDPNDVQLVVSVLFVGLTVGQLVAGPLADRFGRRPIMHAGFALFILGAVLSASATSFGVLLAGRLLQGLGAAGPRIVTLAIVRDGYAGREMARIMSIVMAVFIIVPTLAPLAGEFLLQLGGWRSTFVTLLAFALVGWSWFSLRQSETLAVEDRRALTLRSLGAGLRQFGASRVALGYTLATGCAFGAFLGYLGSAPQVFQQSYATGSWFAVWFGVASLSIGAASIANASLVRRFGMRTLSGLALATMAVVSTVFLAVVVVAGGVPAFGAFMLWLLVALGCMGVLFGNLNALAMEPLGDIAGLGAALVGSLSTLVSLPLAWLIGQGYDGGIESLVAGFAGLGIVAFLVVCATERKLPWLAGATDEHA